MGRFAELLFYTWVLSIPFYRFSLIGTLSLDNILGPLLIVAWPLVRPPADVSYARAQVRNIAISASVLFVYFIAHIATLLSTQDAIWRSAYVIVTDLSYFVVPLLYIRTERIRVKAEDCVILVAIIGAFSAFLSAIGVIHLDVSRYSDSRVVVEGLDLTRSIGLFSTFGDLALLSAFAAMTALSMQRPTLLFIKRSRVALIFLFFMLLLGLLGAQSRNIVLTMVVSLVLFLLFRRWALQGKNWLSMYNAMWIGGGLLSIVVAVFLWQPLVDLLAGWGGKQASATAHGRLEQYQLAFALLSGNPFTGASSEIQERMALTIAGIHNMWLKELVQGGVFAILALIGLIMLTMRNAKKCVAAGKLDESALTSLVFMVALVISTQFNPSGTSVFWMLLGFSVAKLCPFSMLGGNAAGVRESFHAAENRSLISRKRQVRDSQRGGQ